MPLAIRSTAGAAARQHALCLLLSLLLAASFASARAQEVSPEVQRLYGEAKTAAAQGDAATAIARYRSILRLAPKLGAAYNNLGGLYFDQGDYPRAIETLQQGLRVSPGMASANAVLGSAYFQMGDYARAEAPLQAAVRANPADDHAQMLLARTLISLSKYSAATQHLKSYTDRHPENQEAWYLLGKSYLQLSTEALGKISEIDPNSVLAHEINGEVDESLKNFDEALVEYKKAIDMAPDKPGTHYHMANAYWVMGKWDSAIEEFQAELKNDPHNCIARWKMSNAMLEKNEAADQVLPVVDQAVQQCPTLMQARVDRARALVKLNRHADALTDLTLAVKDSPDEPSIHFLLAAVYRAQGNTTQAQAEMQTYARLQRSASAATAERANQAIDLKSKAH